MVMENKKILWEEGGIIIGALRSLPATPGAPGQLCYWRPPGPGCPS